MQKRTQTVSNIPIHHKTTEHEEPLHGSACKLHTHTHTTKAVGGPRPSEAMASTETAAPMTAAAGDCGDAEPAELWLLLTM